MQRHAEKDDSESRADVKAVGRMPHLIAARDKASHKALPTTDTSHATPPDIQMIQLSDEHHHTASQDRRHPVRDQSKHKPEAAQRHAAAESPTSRAPRATLATGAKPGKDQTSHTPKFEAQGGPPKPPTHDVRLKPTRGTGAKGDAPKSANILRANLLLRLFKIL